MEPNMLESTRISRRQSEIRQRLSELVGKSEPTDDETREMETLDQEYRSNETKYRAALISEDDERRQAQGALGDRAGNEWSQLVGQFEVRQAVAFLDEGAPLSGATQEVVSELRQAGGYRGTPVPWEALLLEQRAGETVASDTPSPTQTAPIVDRIFASSVARRMGARFINVGVGEREIPIATNGVTAGWADGETGTVAGPTQFTTVNRELKPTNNVGAQVSITRRALRQSGQGLEQAIRRDLSNALRVEMDRAAMLGSGTSGEPTGLLNSGITSTAADAAPTFGLFLTELSAFMVDNAVTDPSQVTVLVRPEVFAAMESTSDADLQTTEWRRLTSMVGQVTTTSNALPAPTGSPAESPALLTTETGGQPPLYVGTWGAVDLVRDVYTNAASGGLLITAISTMDIAAGRTEQARQITGLQAG
jgi:HK97 family phage major capsid protein